MRDAKPVPESPFLAVPPDRWVAENELAFAIRDGFPVSPGHTLIVTRRLVADWFAASPEEQAACLALLGEVRAQLDREFAPDGDTVGFNAGLAAGQTVPHLHVHVIPRFTGDQADPRGGARRVVELYWPQVRPWGKRGVLRQNAGSQAKIAALILDYRQRHPDQLRPPRRDSAEPSAARLFREVEWVLVEYPLPRVQRVGGGEERFLYELGWDDSIQRRRFNGEDFDNRILLRPEAAASLVSLAAILRPLVQQHWMAMVLALNKLSENTIQDFLFGSERVQLDKLRAPLLEMQSATCFYCETSLHSRATHVDHFLPWSRHPDDGLDNLVAAHDACNRDKLHFLADLGFAKRWQARNRDLDHALSDLAASVSWPRDPRRTRGIVAAAYLAAPEGIRLWGGRGALRPLATPDLPAVHAFGRSLLTP